MCGSVHQFSLLSHSIVLVTIEVISFLCLCKCFSVPFIPLKDSIAVKICLFEVLLEFLLHKFGAMLFVHTLCQDSGLVHAKNTAFVCICFIENSFSTSEELCFLAISDRFLPLHSLNIFRRGINLRIEFCLFDHLQT